MFTLQFQVIAVGIVCAAVFICWLVFGGTTFNIGLTPIIAIVFLIASLGLFFWVFFTPKGKAFARKYNKIQNTSKYTKIQHTHWVWSVISSVKKRDRKGTKELCRLCQDILILVCHHRRQGIPG